MHKKQQLLVIWRLIEQPLETKTIDGKSYAKIVPTDIGWLDGWLAG